MEDVQNKVGEAEVAKFKGDERISEPVVAAPSAGSLAGRMASRQEELARNSTEVFPLPGWEDMLGVELRVLSYSTIRKIGQRNEKVRDEVQQELNNIVDQLITATEGFVEVDGEKVTPIEESWVSLANKLPHAPDDMTARQAILFLVGDKRIHFLAADWMQWSRASAHDLDKEVGSDFDLTG
ncbi:hypothetical protein UFOVP1313_12 [uncultured Caudovirales phage]|uniref:Uncharacterized protein n=1 Tax=uncultured Caudovirales phage TaxID=2100421 RepID=A0A6J5RV36_9CAUD|nr:hypothetical protein UFOVP1313_12 [uncultured Caudovirales phage]